ncbi:MAG: ABC transporter substrate-binding protein [Ignavibacteria bacterium]|nr:ABC transporter substrate-binding protein [Ignavibacteria bacterium]
MKNLFLFLIFSLFVAGCGKQQTEEIRQLNGGIKGGGIYNINELEDIRSLDPVGINDVVSHHVAHQIYDALIDLDSNLQIVPQLAKSYTVSEDGLTYTFNLRTGSTFHDNDCFPGGKGREVNAKDVKYSYDRIVDFRTSSRGFNYFVNYVEGAQEYYDETRAAQNENREPKLNGASGFIYVNDTTFQIKLKKAFAPFIYYNTLAIAYIVPKEAVEKYGKDFFQNPVGSGPFIFVNWTPDQELNLKRNPNYWAKDEFGNQLPYIDAAKFRFIKDLDAQLLEFKNGKLDESYRLPNAIFKTIIDDNKSLTPEWSQFQLQRVPTLATQFYGFLVTNEIFKNEKLRQAINYAIDREKIIKYVLNGQGYAGATHGFVPPSMPDYNTEGIKGYSFDLEKAKKLLEEAGYPGGKGLPELTLQINSGGDRNIQIAEAIQNMLKEVGITMKLQQIQFAQHLDNIDAGKASFYRLGWIADYPDPESFLNLYYGKNVPKNPNEPSPINSMRFVNPEYDRIFEQAITTQDRTQRMKLYEQAEQIAVNQAPMLYIYYDEDYRLLQPYVKGYALDPMHRVNFRNLWLDK